MSDDVRHDPPTPVPPTAPPAGRAIAPDLARGLMLLLIALANVSWFLYGAPTAGTSAHRTEPTTLESVWQTIAIVAIDGRSYPLFALLFGYGIWQFASRQFASHIGEPATRRVLQRRNLWLLAFGAVDAALLWFGDVLGAYGIVGLIVVWLFFRRTTKTLVVWCIVLTGLLVLFSVFSLIGGLFAPSEAAFYSPNLSEIESWTASIVPRILLWAVLSLLQGPFGLVVPIMMLLGIVAARHRVLEEPLAHRALLVRVAVIGIPIGWLGAIPSLLVHRGDLELPGWSVDSIGSVTGMFCGLGYAALFGLLALRFARGETPGPVTRSLVAVGKRSLSSYLLQSLLLAPLLSAWGLGLGGVIEQWQAALIAVAVWGVSIIVAVALERRGARGPAEWLLRKLAYRRSPVAPTPIRG